MAGFRHRLARGLAPMRRRRGFIKRIHRDRPEYAKLHGHRLLERSAAFWLRHIMRERRPRQVDTGTLGLGRGRLRFGTADRGDAAFAACNALRCLMQIADRAFTADRTVIGVRRLDAETVGELNFRIAVAPAQEIDDVERLDFAKQLAAAVLFGALERFDEQGEGLEGRGKSLWVIDDFADADDDGDAVVGDGGGWVSHGFLFSLSKTQAGPHPEERPLGRVSKDGRNAWTRGHPSRRAQGALLRMRSEIYSQTLTMRNSLLRHQRVHVLHRLDKIFLEFLHHGAGGFHAVDQAYALANEIADEVARLHIACSRGAIDGVERVAADDALQR